MNTVMLTSDFLPNIGGIAAHVYHLSRSLSKKGVNLAVLNPVYEDKRIIRKTVHNDVLTYKVGYPFRKNSVQRIWERTHASKIALKQINKDMGGIQILHQHDYTSTSIIPLLFRDNAKWVWTNHSSNFLIDYKSGVKKRIIPQIYRKLDGLITVSEELFLKSREVFSSSIPKIYIPNGVDVSMFEPNDVPPSNLKKYHLSNKDFIILCPRRMVEKNGIIYFAEAVRKIIQKKPDVPWKFVFLGSDNAFNTQGHYISKVKGTLEEFYEKGFVRYLGNIPMEEMGTLNAISDLVVIPSLIEAISLSALEAMATKKPVIATNVGGLPEIIKDNDTGVLVPPSNSDAIAHAILKLYNDNFLKQKVATNGYEVVLKEYSWDHIADKTLAFYKELLKTT